MAKIFEKMAKIFEKNGQNLKKWPIE